LPDYYTSTYSAHILRRDDLARISSVRLVSVLSPWLVPYNSPDRRLLGSLNHHSSIPKRCARYERKKQTFRSGLRNIQFDRTAQPGWHRAAWMAPNATAITKTFPGRQRLEKRLCPSRDQPRLHHFRHSAPGTTRRSTAHRSLVGTYRKWFWFSMLEGCGDWIRRG